MLGLAPLLFTGEAVLTGGVYAPLEIAYQSEPLLSRSEALGIGPPRSPILGDVVSQMIPWQKAVREAVGNGRLPLWNRFVLAGEPLLAVQQHGALHPTFWPGLLLPPAAAWTLSLTLRLFLALLCQYLFLREIGCREISSLLGASAWAFSDFLIFFLGYALNASIGPLPLLLLGLRRLAREPGRGAVGVTLAALLLMATGGHPETLLHGVAGAGVYFLFELSWASRTGRGRSLGLALVSGALALGLTAALFLPFREAVLRTTEYRGRVNVYARSDRSDPLPVALERSIKNVVPHAFGTWAHGGEQDGFAGAAGYAGAVLLPLALAGLVSRRRERWPMLVLAGLGLAAWARLPVFSDAIARLPLFDVALNEYLVVLLTLSIAVLAAFGVERLIETRRRSILLVTAAIAAAAIGLLSLHVEPNLSRIPPPARTLLWMVQIVPVALLALFAFLRHTNAAWRAFPAIALVLLLAQRRVEAGSFYSTLSARAFYPPIPLFDLIPRGEPFRFAAVSYTFVPNIATMYGLEDVRGYEAMTLAPLTETFPLWCVPQPVWFNRIDDPTRPFLSFLNVRYVIAPRRYPPPPGWRVLAEEPSLRLLENPTALPRAFVPRWIVRESDPGRERERLFAIRNFADDGVVVGPASPPERNGEATVEIASYTAQRMVLSILARQKALIATSTTGWPGWRLTVDGRERPLLAYNRAFLAFEVPPGRHEAVLRYWPRSFTAGLWISGLSLLLTVALLVWPRRAASDKARSPAIGERVLAADH